MDTSEIRYPEVNVPLAVGQYGNAFMILGAVTRALRESGVPQEELTEFVDEATRGDYDHLLQTVVKWVDVS